MEKKIFNTLDINYLDLKICVLFHRADLVTRVVHEQVVFVGCLECLEWHKQEFLSG